LFERLAVVKLILVKDVFDFFVELGILRVRLEECANRLKGLIGVSTFDKKIVTFTAST
jgi:hypothetical protein